MHYQQVARRGWPIGSEAVESACRQKQTRFKRCGQFWTQTGLATSACSMKPAATTTGASFGPPTKDSVQMRPCERGMAICPVPIPNSKARLCPASTARKSTFGVTASGTNISAEGSSYLAATWLSKYPSVFIFLPNVMSHFWCGTQRKAQALVGLMLCLDRRCDHLIAPSLRRSPHAKSRSDFDRVVARSL